MFVIQCVFDQIIYLPEFYKQFQRAEKQFAHYLATGQQSAAKISKEFYEESLTEMGKYLTETTVNFDLFSLGVASVLLYFVSFIHLYEFLNRITQSFLHVKG